MIEIINDIEECAHYWQRFIESRMSSIFDFWELRKCFHDAYRHTPCFFVLKDKTEVRGLLPLSMIWESGEYGFFPGEVWKNKTWIECNRWFVQDAADLDLLLSAVDAPFNLRYLEKDRIPQGFSCFDIDETGYLFYPLEYGFSFDSYLNVFPRKSLKKIIHEIDKLKQLNVSYRYNDIKDFKYLVDMNISSYGEYSYFSDPRFVSAFEKMIAWLADRGYLQITTVIIGGEKAAIDIGAIWNRHYTVLGGGVCRDFPSVAKLINFHHLERACKERLNSVDFLCGDFNWKARFRLTPRPLYKIANNTPVPEKAEIGTVCMYA